MRGTSTLRNMGMSSTLYGPTGDPLEAPADPEVVQRQRVNWSNTGEITLSSAPTSGNTLILFGYVNEASESIPGDFTELASSYSGGTGYVLAAKVSEGDETSVTLGGASRLEYQEWSGMAPLVSIYDGDESVVTVGSGAAWNPAEVTADQPKAVYLVLVGLGNSSGTVTSDWADTDTTYNTALLLGGHKIVTDGSSFDTAATWTNDRPMRGGVFVLRGEA